MIDVFIAYSHHDLPYKDELKKFLRPLLREEDIKSHLLASVNREQKPIN